MKPTAKLYEKQMGMPRVLATKGRGMVASVVLLSAVFLWAGGKVAAEEANREASRAGRSGGAGSKVSERGSSPPRAQAEKKVVPVVDDADSSGAGRQMREARAGSTGQDGPGVGRADRFRTMPIGQVLTNIESSGRRDRVAVAEALLERRAEALPALRAVLLDGTSSQKVFAVTLLAEMRDSGSTPSLVKLTGSPDMKLSLMAINALRDIGAREALPELKSLLSAAGLGEGHKVCLLAAIGRLGGPAEAAVARAFLEDPNDSVQTAAAAALAMLGSSEGKALLLKMTESDNQFAQRLAIESLGYFSDPEGQSLLKKRVAAPGGRWKTEARIALERRRLGGVPGTEERLREFGKLASDPNYGVAKWAIGEIAERGDEQAKQVLRDLSRGTGASSERAKTYLKLRGGDVR